MPSRKVGMSKGAMSTLKVDMPRHASLSAGASPGKACDKFKV
jgi:hypothetical protein